MTKPGQTIRFLSVRNPAQRVNPEVLSRLVAAQNNFVDSEFANAAQLYAKVFADLRLSLDVPEELEDIEPQIASDRPLSKLIDDFIPTLANAGIVGSTARVHAANLAQRTQLVRAFDDPDSVLQRVTTKVEEVVRSFPREAKDIERGRNPGDVLDPYILNATQTLLFGGDFRAAIGATVSHKALMIIEGLMGHLHEDVLGMMRGNVRAPEPRGFNQ